MQFSCSCEICKALIRAHHRVPHGCWQLGHLSEVPTMLAVHATLTIEYGNGFNRACRMNRELGDNPRGQADAGVGNITSCGEHLQVFH